MHEKSKTGQKNIRPLRRCLRSAPPSSHRRVRLVSLGVPSPTQLNSLRKQGWNFRGRIRQLSLVSGSVGAGRLAQYLVGHASHTWHFLLEASGPCYRAALVVFFLLCSSLNVPLSWNMTAGGDTVTWVGFELLLHSHQLGISLGRTVYVADALEFE